MNRRKSTVALVLIAASALALAGCTPAPGTRVLLTPASVPLEGTVSGEGANLTCGAGLETIALNADTATRWKGHDIGYKAEVVDNKQQPVVITVNGDVNVKSAIVHFFNAPVVEGQPTPATPTPVAVQWPYDASGVEAELVPSTYSQTSAISGVTLCIAPAVEQAAE